ncbi:MAG: LamB/YcsF family protein, partial [Opitutales bacterium]
MEQILINCDLGENESDEQTQRLLGLVDAASICCGTHAGSLAKTRKTLNQAAAKGVMVGAHPGLSADRGRGDDLPDADHFRRIL